MTPHRSFLVLGLGFGALFVLATPPFAPPDELRHFLRAYLVSEGRFAVPGQAPGYSASIPTSLARLEPSPSQRGVLVDGRSRRRERDGRLPARKWSSKWMIWVQDLLATYAFFI